MLVDEIPVGHTPPGGYGSSMPPPVLAGCTEPLVPGAPDLHGMWRVVAVEVAGVEAPATHPMNGSLQRVEQAGDRLVVTSGGIVHDMRCNGTVDGGVHDVMAADFSTPITVVASYENGVHVLRPVGISVEITRRRDDAQMVWEYVGFTARLERIGDPAHLVT